MRAIVVVREPGRQKVDHSLEFDLLELPRVGDYISIFRPDSKTQTEDVIVRHVWWHLSHPETRGTASGETKVGHMQDVMLECDIALSPYARDHWRSAALAARSRGVEVEEFKVSRIVAGESDQASP